MNELALFAGGGGGLYASLLLGHTTVCAVEIEPANRRMLLQRQIDGVFPRFPIWDDVRTFDGKPWRGVVDVVSGGFPCQDISCAGSRSGIDGARSGLWVEMARIISEIQPKYAFVENSPMLASSGLYRVLGDLAEMGFDARWGVFSACAHGASHTRSRMFVLAHSRRHRREARQGFESAPPSEWSGGNRPPYGIKIRGDSARHPWLPSRPGVCRVVNGVADWKHRIFALGNGQVPRVAAAAWRMLNRDR